jgi:hypothetical protein
VEVAIPGNAAIGNLAVNLSLETAAFTDGATKAQTQMRALAGSAHAMSRGFGGFNSSANSTRIVALELTHITRSLGEQLAMGVSPARAFSSEIARIATAAQYAGGIGGLGRTIAGMVAPFASLAAGAGILATAFIGVKQAADDTSMKAYIATLGLTDAQIKKLKDTTVTWGDVTKATFQVLAEKAGTSSGAISGAFSSAFRSVGEFGKFAASVILASFGAAVKGTADVVKNFPYIVDEAMTAAANLGVAALEKMVNVGVGALNKLGGAVNSVLGTNIGQIAEVSFGRFHSSFAGTMKAIGTDVSGTFHDIFNKTEATFDAISARAVKLREANLAGQAAELKAGDAAGKAAKGHQAHAKAIKEETDALDKLLKGLDALLYKQQEVDSDLRNAKPLGKLDFTPDVLTPAIEKAKSSWQQWADTVPQTAGEIADAFEGIATRGFDSISGGIADVITGAKSLKDAFAEVAKSIIHDILEMTVKMLIFRAISAAFGKVDYSSLNATIDANSATFGVQMPHFANGGSGTFGGFGGVDNNLLSLNGSPIARVSKGEQFSVSPANSNNPGRVVIELRDSMLDARIAEGANVQIVRNAPALISGAKGAIREANRRRA